MKNGKENAQGVSTSPVRRAVLSRGSEPKSTNIMGGSAQLCDYRFTSPCLSYTIVISALPYVNPCGVLPLSSSVPRVRP